ncbi:metal-dependent hydrolase, partial [Patescibacteria group bacterium]
MSKLRKILKSKSETLHLLIHIFLGVASALLVNKLFPASDVRGLIGLGVIGNTLPDLDHVIYFLTYGKKTEYSTMVKNLLSAKRISELRKFLKQNHKYLTGLYSHTLLSPVITSLLSLYFFRKSESYLLALFLSFSAHFIYDIVEDFLFFG